VSERVGELGIAGDVAAVVELIGGGERCTHPVAEHGFDLRLQRSAHAAQMLSLQFQG
jgi:hypothetical protein